MSGKRRKIYCRRGIESAETRSEKESNTGETVKKRIKIKYRVPNESRVRKSAEEDLLRYEAVLK